MRNSLITFVLISLSFSGMAYSISPAYLISLYHKEVVPCPGEKYQGESCLHDPVYHPKDFFYEATGKTTKERSDVERVCNVLRTTFPDGSPSELMFKLVDDTNNATLVISMASMIHGKTDDGKITMSRGTWVEAYKSLLEQYGDDEDGFFRESSNREYMVRMKFDFNEKEQLIGYSMKLNKFKKIIRHKSPPYSEYRYFKHTQTYHCKLSSPLIL